MSTTELAEKIVRFIAGNMGLESALLCPDPEPILSDPYGLLMIIEESGVSPETIDGWMVDEQKPKSTKGVRHE